MYIITNKSESTFLPRRSRAFDGTETFYVSRKRIKWRICRGRDRAGLNALLPVPPSMGVQAASHLEEFHRASERAKVGEKGEGRTFGEKPP